MAVIEKPVRHLEMTRPQDLRPARPVPGLAVIEAADASGADADHIRALHDAVATAHHWSSLGRSDERWQEVLQAWVPGRVVRPGGHVAFEVGEVRNSTMELENQVLAALKFTPFVPECVMINAQAFTKTANCWGVSNNARGTNSNRIVLARRH
jgi:hypothetical protein